MVELMNQVPGKDRSCLEFWVDLNSRSAEIDLENKNGSEIEQLLIMAIFLSGTTENDFEKSEEAIKALDKAEKRQADMLKLKGHKEPKEVIN